LACSSRTERNSSFISAFCSGLWKRHSRTTLKKVYFRKRVSPRSLATSSVRCSSNLRLPQPVRGLFGEVGDDQVGSGPPDRCQNLQSRPLFVDPPLRSSGLHPPVFAADVVRGEWHVEARPCP